MQRWLPLLFYLPLVPLMLPAVVRAVLTAPLRHAWRRHVDRPAIARERAVRVAVAALAFEGTTVALDALYTVARELYAPVAGVHEDLAPAAAILGRNVETARWELSPEGDYTALLRLARRADIRAVAVDASDSRTGHRATVRIAATASIRPTRPGAFEAWRRHQTRRLISFLTFECKGGSWQLVKVEPGRSGAHHLARPQELQSREYLRMDEQVILACESAGTGTRLPLDIARGLPYEPEHALRDLGQVDDRFDMRVVDVCVRQILRAWEQAPPGVSAALAGVASPAAERQLMSRRYHIIRGCELREVSLFCLHAYRNPVEVTLDIEVKAWMGGDRDIGAHDTYPPRLHGWRWRLALHDDGLPWRLTDTDD